MTWTPEEIQADREYLASLSPEKYAKIMAERNQTHDKELALFDANSKGLEKVKAYAAMEDVQTRFKTLLGDREGRAYVESVVICVASSTQLQQCTPKSIMIQAMRAASMKLSLDPIMEQAYLVAYKDQATLIPDYRGLVQLSANTNYYDVAPDVNEVFEGEIVKKDRFSGKIEITGEQVSEKIIGWCAYYKAKNGIERWLYMTNEQCDKHAKTYNPAGYGNANTPWNAHNGRDRDKMRRKTVLRIFVKRYGNFSPVVANFIKQSEAIEGEVFDLPSDENVIIPKKTKKTEKQNLKELGFGE